MAVLPPAGAGKSAAETEEGRMEWGGCETIWDVMGSREVERGSGSGGDGACQILSPVANLPFVLWGKCPRCEAVGLRGRSLSEGPDRVGNCASDFLEAVYSVGKSQRGFLDAALGRTRLSEP